MENILLEFNNIHVRSGTVVLFEELSFRVAVNGSWVILGESGSGKTALLQTIAGGNAIVKGSVLRPFLENELSRRKAGFPNLTIAHLIALVSTKHVFKSNDNTTGFYYQQRFNSFDAEEAPTVAEQLQPLKAYASEHYWTYEKVVADLQLQHLLDKQVIKLSNGETRRLLIAKALITNPVLLLMDAPFTGLDPQARQELNKLITEIIASGIAVIIATTPYEIPAAITHVAVLENRKIVSTQASRNFIPAISNIKTAVNIDGTALKELLANSRQSIYNCIVKMSKVVIRYGEKVILDHISWQVNAGERWALAGHNGSGKSTLLSLINGDNPQAFANDIILFDRKKGSGESIWDIKQKIGFVSPELFQYFPAGISCQEAIESGFYDTIGLFRPATKANAEIITKWMKLLGIESIARLRLQQVSESQQRLCLLARALVKAPVLLILDEPCQGLDDQQRNYFRSLIDAVCLYSNTTLIYVSHYDKDIPSVVTKVLRLKDGKQADT